MSRGGVVAATGLVAVAAIAALAVYQAQSDDASTRDALVAEHSREVMPFDLAKSTHGFEPTAGGLIETVIENPPADPAQVALIRGHLAAEATAFGSGNFDDPARIHGEGMPGLRELRAQRGAVAVRYTDLSGGGKISYTSPDPALIDALHRFGAAQSSDHNHEHGG